MGQPLSLLGSTALVANGLRGRLFTRAWLSLDNGEAWSLRFDEGGRRAQKNFSGVEHA
jgi:hypothetical protein